MDKVKLSYHTAKGIFWLKDPDHFYTWLDGRNISSMLTGELIAYREQFPGKVRVEPADNSNGPADARH
jgi:hypothetical protein